MRLPLLAVLLLLGGCTSAQPAQPPLVAAALERLVAEAAATQSTAIVVRQGGREAVRRWFDERPRLVGTQSVTKSVAALAVGRLLTIGALDSLDVPMHRFFPTWAHDGRSAITLRHVLTHSSGLGPPEVRYPSAVATALAAPLVAAPGTSFRYDGVTVQLVAEVVRQLAGKPLDRFVGDELFAPLGITRWHWRTDAVGLPDVSGGLALAAEDLATVGQLLLDGGTWQGKQLLSAAFLAELQRPSQAQPRYGLLWWLEPDGIRANGWQGQHLLVLPAKKLVVVRLREPRDLHSQEENERFGFHEALAPLARALVPARLDGTAGASGAGRSPGR
ncbi:serine hydrolase domain-containing protein [Vulgatibacter sp.]|uniref:serine hydrolase domain-containing protein n=1 Tax=Vulgatibacter sp. TaxID=1971226 RepID=UPI0035656902